MHSSVQMRLMSLKIGYKWKLNANSRIDERKVHKVYETQ